MIKNTKQFDNLIDQSALNKKQYIFDLVVSVVLLLVMGFIVFTTTFWIETVEVHQSSMNDTLEQGDIVILDNLAKPDRFDIVVFDFYDSSKGITEKYIKRVIGMPGDTIYSINGVVYLKKKGESQAKPLKEDYVKKLPNSNEPYPTYVDYASCLDININTVVPEGCYYVLGDNRKISKDSRAFGFISKEQLHGVVHQFWVDNKENIKKYVNIL